MDNDARTVGHDFHARKWLDNTRFAYEFRLCRVLATPFPLLRG